jgi:hypothetical protein
MRDNWTIMVYISADDLLANFAIESLKQLRNAAGKGIFVVAEFDDNQERDARLYFFDGNPEKRSVSIEESRIRGDELARLKTIRDVDMSRPETLTEFINYACHKSKTQRYCLVLWGHGIELLLDEERRFGTTKEPRRRYLSIGHLRDALEKTDLATGLLGDHPKTQSNSSSLDIIGIDACSMSMIELASELQGCADFMIASQEDVPDTSFPYENILSDLQAAGVRDDVTKVCKMIPSLYSKAFADYIATPGTGVKGITLTSLRLEKTGGVLKPLTKLATALLDASSDELMREVVLSARKKAKDFVFGLLVDLSDFSNCLIAELGYTNIRDTALKSDLQAASNDIIAALKGGDDRAVIANESNEGRCHGLSIYLPYRKEDKTDEVEERFAKGTGREPLKGTGREPLKERTARIRELEEDFAGLTRFQSTAWSEFIQHGWSRILALAKETRNDLDHYYSAQQVARNLVSVVKASDKRYESTVKPHEPSTEEHAA